MFGSNPLQLQNLHNQVLLEQQQESAPRNIEFSQSEQEHLDQCNKQVDSTLHPVPLPLKQTPPSLLNTIQVPAISTSPVLLLSTISAPLFETPPMSRASAKQTEPIPIPEINTSTIVFSNKPLASQENMALNSQLNTVPTNVPPPEQCTMLGHGALWPENNREPNPPMTQLYKAPVFPISHLNETLLSQLTAHSIPMSLSTVSPTPSFPHQSVAPKIKVNSGETAEINLNTPIHSSPIVSMNIAHKTQMNLIPVSPGDIASVITQSLINTSGSNYSINTALRQNQHSMEPTLVQNINTQNLTAVPLNKVTSSHLLKNGQESVQGAPPVSITQTQPLSINSISSANSLQSFSYARPLEFIAAHTLTPVRSPSPTLFPFTQNVPKPTTDLTSSRNPFAPSQQVFPARLKESPKSPPYAVSPPLVPAAPVRPEFALRPQSPPQASSPTSISSTSSPIQNPVAFLSSVLPSLPTSPATNAMGLPKRAPPR